ncbi:MAG: alanine dehydrogenase [Chloroflexi bacterium]|nr:alanine dehydrogenase [Chloroflexota bacterium]
MIVGVPKEIKDLEFRVAIPPAAVEALCSAGHSVMIQTGAGQGSDFSNEAYLSAGAEVVADAVEVFRRADMIVKVKEPLPEELGLLRESSILFTFLHLAAGPHELLTTLLERRITAIGYETVQEPDGTLPLLVPMSQVAGRMAVQVAASLLQKDKDKEGVGKLLGGIPGVEPCHVIVLGSGVVSENAVQVAVGMGARATVLSIDNRGLRRLDQMFRGGIVTLALTQQTLREAIRDADVVISGVLSPGARAPKLVTRDMVKSMKPGSVIVDVSVDQGGTFETTRPTTHSKPTYIEHGVIHYCVTNIPGVVPHTSSIGLANVTLPYILKLANYGIPEALKKDVALARGVNTYKGYVTHLAVAEALGIEHKPLESLL